jgi:hypothetical protein
MRVELKEVKSSLARLLASENLTVQHANVPTASFDVENRVLTCPTLKDMGSELYDTIMGHEVAHALWTPTDGWKDVSDEQNFRGFVNVIEDARIERFIKAKFPGLNKSFFKGYSDLHHNRDFFKIAEKNVEEMLLIDRINLKAKLGAILDYDFTDAVEKEFFDRAMTTVSWDDVMTLSKELYEYCKEEMEQKQEQQQPQMPQMGENPEDGEGEKMPMPAPQEEGEEKDEAGNPEQSESDEDSGEQEQSESSEQGEETGESETQEQQEVESDRQSVTGTLDAGETQDNTVPVAETYEAERKSMLELVDVESEVSTVNFPTNLNLDNIVVPSKQILEDLVKYWGSYRPATAQVTLERIQGKVREFELKNKKVVNYLAKEFEMKKAAKEQARAFTSKTGQLNTNKLFSYKYNDDIFNRKTELPTGKNHGMVFFLDWSGSMHSQMEQTMDQLMNLVMFCKRVNIPFDVYAFTDRFESQTELQTPRTGELVLKSGFRLLELSSSRLNNTDYRKSLVTMMTLRQAFTNDWREQVEVPHQYYLGGTPLDDAIVVSRQLLEKFQKENRVEIVNAVFLTDGVSHNVDSTYNHELEEKYFNTRGHTIYRDVKSGVQVSTFSERWRMSNQMRTKALYEVVKRATGFNMVGFFLTTNRDIWGLFSDFGFTYDDCYDAKETFKKQKSLVVTHTGLDELYVLNGKSLKLDDENPLDGVDETATKAKLKTAFKKATGGKVQNRIILNRFIEKIAANM